MLLSIEYSFVPFHVYCADCKSNYIISINSFETHHYIDVPLCMNVSLNTLVFIYTACPAGTYRSMTDRPDVCRECPHNTKRDQPGAALCDCELGSFRAPGEGLEVGCTCKMHL